ncbi:MAG: VOC family protein [Pseudomonadota bacterium]
MDQGCKSYRNPMVIHYVSNMDRAREFYASVFGAEATFKSAGWTTLAFGSVTLALHITSPERLEQDVMPHAGLNFEVDHLETAQAEIEAAGGEMLSLREAEPHVPVRVAAFKDPDGNGFELRQAVTA